MPLVYILLALIILATAAWVVLAPDRRQAGMALGLNALALSLVALSLAQGLLTLVWALVGLVILLWSAMALSRAELSSVVSRRWLAVGGGLLTLFLLAAVLLRGYIPGAPPQIGSTDLTAALMSALNGRYAPALWALALALLAVALFIPQSGGDA